MAASAAMESRLYEIAALCIGFRKVGVQGGTYKIEYEYMEPHGHARKENDDDAKIDFRIIVFEMCDITPYTGLG